MSNVGICSTCRFSARGCSGPCACTVDGRDILDHAKQGECPHEFFKHPEAPARLAEPAPQPWPWIVLQIVRFRRLTDRGVGDTLEAAFSAMGADLVKAALTKAGIECGCEGRKAWFNARFPYACSE